MAIKNIQNLLRDGRVDRDGTKDIYHLDESKAPDIVAKIKSGDILLGDGHIYVLISEDGSKEVVIGNSSDTYDSAFKVSASSDEPTTVNWDDIEDKPETFAPTIGTTEDTAKAGDWTPAVADVPNLPTSKITSGTFADARIPSLAISKITGLQTELNSKADSTDIPDVSGFATTSELTSGLAGKANTSHTHTVAQVTGLQTTLDEKAGTSVATDSANGLMSSADKQKLDGVEEGANVYLDSNVLSALQALDGYAEGAVLQVTAEGIQWVTP